MTEKFTNIRAKKSLGQNFLIDESALYDIAHSVPVWGKNIVEVGPWYGALTDYLIEQDPETLTLVELDTDMIDILNSRFQIQDSKFTIIHQDVLQFAPNFLEYSVIANIPYYITSPILFHFLYSEDFVPPESMVIMMQEEVWEKILEWRHPKKPHHSLLSLAMEEACEDIDIVRYVPRTSFDPAPKVDSIVLRFVVRKSRDRKQEQSLIWLWKVAFAHPRKTFLSNMKGSAYDVGNIRTILLELGYDERIRSEAIRREDWKRFL